MLAPNPFIDIKTPPVVSDPSALTTQDTHTATPTTQQPSTQATTTAVGSQPSDLADTRTTLVTTDSQSAEEEAEREGREHVEMVARHVLTAQAVRGMRERLREKDHVQQEGEVASGGQSDAGVGDVAGKQEQRDLVRAAQLAARTGAELTAGEPGCMQAHARSVLFDVTRCAGISHMLGYTSSLQQ